MAGIAQLTALLNREPLVFELPDLERERLLITGHKGFLGQLVRSIAVCFGAETAGCDQGHAAIGTKEFVKEVHRFKPTACIHLAAHKHAPLGEEQPYEVAELNIAGTQAVLGAIGDCDLILASTCKAADPATAYGASKLIAERMVLNAGHTVIRLVNVLDSSGSLLRIWEQIPKDDPLPVVEDATRYWITPLEACEALIGALILDPGRYCPAVFEAEPVSALAKRYAPDRPTKAIPPRRGDRLEERLIAEYEDVEEGPLGYLRISDPWPMEGGA